MTVYQRTLSFDGDALKIFNAFKGRPQAFFLDSSMRRPGPSFSYLGSDPFKTVRGRDLRGVKKVFDRYRMARQSLAFPAGAVGYLGYDGSVCFGFYDTILAVDHQNKKLIISSFHRSRIKDILERINEDNREVTPQALKKEESDFKSNFTKAGYMKAVRQALEHIRRGDIYQINLSHRIRLDRSASETLVKPADIYQRLRHAFPSEFGAYFDDGKRVILSASPERFLRLKGRIVQVKPMKGTRPRGKTRSQDKALKAQLRKSPKEIAELLMVTDLERNDLGRVCKLGSIKVKAMRTIETYRSVFQATSTVEGCLRRDCDQFDLLRAAFPSGSVTGCPKLEAMKIIDQLERAPRGLYTGALGYMSFCGDMDFNVMIRSIFVDPREISFHVGGGIVADSKPADEWQETWDKAKPMIEALKRADL